MFSFLTLQRFINKNTQLKWLKYVLKKKGKHEAFSKQQNFFFLGKAFFEFGQLNLQLKKKKKVKLWNCCAALSRRSGLPRPLNTSILRSGTCGAGRLCCCSKASPVPRAEAGPPAPLLPIPPASPPPAAPFHNNFFYCERSLMRKAQTNLSSLGWPKAVPAPSLPNIPYLPNSAMLCTAVIKTSSSAPSFWHDHYFVPLIYHIISAYSAYEVCPTIAVFFPLKWCV